VWFDNLIVGKLDKGVRMSLVRVREKGQVRLPLELINQMGLQKGDLLEASVEDGRIVLELVVRRREVPVTVAVHTLEELVGMVKLGGEAVIDSARYDQ
jgi:bifunctional DNA-binding transcriptional regulator/antitoxin component of YhaV-PrlF toxin-antitoxin module